MKHKLTVYEEETNLIWGLVVVVTTAAGTFLLGDAFADDAIFKPGIRQLTALVFFSLSFVGIVKISEPLYRFELHIEQSMLTINTYKSDNHVKTLKYALTEIDWLGYRPRTPPSENEALLDFTSNYYLMIHLKNELTPRRLIELDGISFTLRVRDIDRIIRFIRTHNPNIKAHADYGLTVDD